MKASKSRINRRLLIKQRSEKARDLAKLKSLPEPERRDIIGRDLFSSIMAAVGDVAGRAQEAEVPLLSEQVVQALCLTTCNVALQEGVPPARILGLVAEYLDQVTEVLRLKQQQEKGELSSGLISLPGDRF